MTLAPSAIPSYLRRHRLISADGKCTITSIPTNVNRIFRVDTPTKSFIVKQATAGLARFPGIPLSTKRIDTEYRSIRQWREVCKDKILRKAIPTILHYDKENNLVVFEAAPKEAAILTHELLAGIVKRKIVKKLAKLLGIIHRHTFADQRLKKEFSDYVPWIDIKLGFFHAHMLKEERDEKIQKALKDLIERTIENKISLIHADTNPKNILVYGDNLLVIDHEFSCFGDPAYDVACLLAHYYLSALINYRRRHRYFTAISYFWNTYEKNSRFSRKIKQKMKRNVLQHFGPILWGRAFGRAGVPFLHPKTREVIREISRTIIISNLTKFKELFDLAEKYQKALTPLPSIDVEKAKQEVTF